MEPSSRSVYWLKEEFVPIRKWFLDGANAHKKTDHTKSKGTKNYTLVFQLEEVCGINVVAHKMKNVSGGI